MQPSRTFGEVRKFSEVRKFGLSGREGPKPKGGPAPGWRLARSGAGPGRARNLVHQPVAQCLLGIQPAPEGQVGFQVLGWAPGCLREPLTKRSSSTRWCSARAASWLACRAPSPPAGEVELSIRAATRLTGGDHA